MYIEQIRILFYTSAALKLNQVFRFLNLYHIYHLGFLCSNIFVNDLCLKKGKLMNLSSFDNIKIYFFNNYIKKK